MPGNRAVAIERLQKRFPALRMRVGWDDAGPGATLVRLPPVFGYIVATAQARPSGITVLVVDRGPWLAPLAAMLVSIHRFGRNADRLVKEFGVTRLQKSQRVRVYPTEYVYEFDGLFRGHEEFVRLRVVGTGERNETRSFPASQILRLHPTERIRPKGTQATRFPEPDTPLEALVGVRTYANPAVFRTNTVLCGSHGDARAFSEHLRWNPSRDAGAVSDGSVISWGGIGPDGALTHDDRYQSAGEPLVAVARTLEDVEVFCRRDATDVLVIVDGFHRAAGHRATLGRISADRHVVILASPAEITDEAEIRELAGQGARIWYMAPEEVLHGLGECAAETLPEPVGAVMQSARARKQAVLRAAPCQDRTIAGLQAELEGAHKALQAHGGDEPAYSDAFAILFWISRVMGEVGFLGVDRYRERVARARDMLNAETAWMPEDALSLLKSVFQRLDELESGTIAGVADDKALKLLGILEDARSQHRERVVVCARDASSIGPLRAWLVGFGFSPEVRTAREMPRDPVDSWELAVLLGWPRAGLFLAMAGGAVAREVVVLAYPFELTAFKWASGRAEDLARQWPPTLAGLVEITGLDAGELPPFRGSDFAPAASPSTAFEPQLPVRSDRPGSDASIEDIETWLDRPVLFHSVATEDRAGDTEAIVLFFEGGSHAFVEPFRSVPSVRGTGHRPDLLEVVSVRAESVTPGDILLFREASDKDIIRLLAEDQLGETQYLKLRQASGQWREALETIGDDPALVRRRLMNHGLEREIATIRRWQEDPELIAPQRHGDVLTIIRASGIHALEAEVDRILNAITILRGAHIASGHELSRLVRERAGAGLRLDVHKDQEVDLGLCTAWLVRVRSIDHQLRRVARGLTNRIIPGPANA